MVIRLNDLFYSFTECEDGNLYEYITLEKYNSCPCCNIVNHPTIIGLIEYPIKENKLVNIITGEISIPLSGSSQNAELTSKPVLVGVETDIVYQCSNTKCKRIFIVHYHSEKYQGEVRNTLIKGVSPYSTGEIKVSENINEICEKYYEIYRQAYLAEKMGLTEICGMGYRKALEFLVKDYVIYLNKDNLNFSKVDLQSKLLGKVISEDIPSVRVQEITRRATWLGNDETHYLRKWVEKDVQSLKDILSIVIHEIDMEVAFRKTIDGMPKGR